MRHDFFYDGYGNKVYMDVDTEIAQALTQAQASGAFDGPPGPKGDSYILTDYDKTQIAATVKASMNAENWTFTLEDGSTVTKAVYVG